MNLPRYALTAILLLALSCSKHPNEPNVKTQSVSGVVDSWQNRGLLDRVTLGVSGHSYFEKLDSATITSDGSFQLLYPFRAPADSMLRTYESLQDSNQYIVQADNVVFSNPAARYVFADFLVYESHHQLSMSLLQANRFLTNDSASAVGDYFVTYSYFDRATTISGSHRMTSYVAISPAHPKFNTGVTMFSLSAAQGWNEIITRIKEVRDSTIVYEISEGAAGRSAWFPTWFESGNFERAAHW